MSPATQTLAQRTDAGTATTVLDITVPVHNDARNLEAFIRRTQAQLSQRELAFTLTIVDCGSSDRTLAIAEKMARELTEVKVLHIESDSVGEGLRYGWIQSDAEILLHLDSKQNHKSSILDALISPLLSQETEVAVGVAEGADEYSKGGVSGRTWRGLRNLALRTFTGDKHLRARTGILAMRAEFARLLLPYAGSQEGFVDTELLILAQRAGLAVAEVPVSVSQDYLDLGESATNDIRGALALRRRIASGEIQFPALRTASASLRGESEYAPAVSIATVGVSTLLLGLLLLAG